MVRMRTIYDDAHATIDVSHFTNSQQKMGWDEIFEKNNLSSCILSPTRTIITVNAVMHLWR